MVVHPNYRGSDGYGRRWQLANRYLCGQGEAQDCAGAHAFLVGMGCDPGRIAVTGRSHGGYLTAQMLTQFPQLWAAGVAGVPFFDHIDAQVDPAVREDLRWWDRENTGDLVKDRARLEYYSPEDLAVIVSRSAGILEVQIDDAGAHAIAERSRGTPRVANRLLKRVRDFAEVKGTGIVDAEVAEAALEMLEVDRAGLDRSDRALLSLIANRFSGGPVGLSTIAVATGEETDTIEDVLEPYLLQLGMLKRTPRGRVLTRHAFEHLGLEPPAGHEQLF
jgi:hypothetical protein